MCESVIIILELYMYRISDNLNPFYATYAIKLEQDLCFSVKFIILSYRQVWGPHMSESMIIILEFGMYQKIDNLCHIH